jgi:hypothetical protein
VKYYKWSWDDPRPAFHAIFQRMLSAAKRVLAAAGAIVGSSRRRRTEIANKRC